jgi:predicted CXXCH cytochrome family protein
MCHEPPGSGVPFQLSMPLDQLCETCHEDQVTGSREAPFRHVPAGGGDCITCHNPHTANGSGLLKQPVQALCLSCHDPGGSRSGEEGRFVSHGDGLDCTTCHAPHGSEQPILLVTDAIDLCGTCHAHQHSVTHPMGEDSRDPRSGQPITCRSCHGLHDAPYPKFLHRDGDRELCIGCHKEKVGGGL